MSLFDYQTSKHISGQDYPFYALIMAAMRQADTYNLERLKKAFPRVWEELEQRYHAPGGVLPQDVSTLVGILTTMFIGFTGTRAGLTDHQKVTLHATLKEYKDATLRYIEFRHGDCKGADAEAHDIAVKLGYTIAIHPPIEKRERAFKQASSGLEFEPRPYLKRNQDIVKYSNVLIACPKSPQEELRSGTWSTVRFARKQNCPTVIIYPDGTKFYESNRPTTSEHPRSDL